MGRVALRAIETKYKGCRFRSRLEARWAVFFDALGIGWDYEPEGFELPSGRYLPDFFLSSLDYWIEIKGVEPSADEDLAADQLAKSSGKSVFMFVGKILLPNTDLGHPEVTGASWFSPYSSPGLGLAADHLYAWCECPSCGSLGIEFDGRTDRLPCKRKGCPTSEHGDKGYNLASQRLFSAYAAALSARFEFGEEG